MDNKKLKVKDLVSIGVFGVIILPSCLELV